MITPIEIHQAEAGPGISAIPPWEMMGVRKGKSGEVYKRRRLKGTTAPSTGVSELFVTWLPSFNMPDTLFLSYTDPVEMVAGSSAEVAHRRKTNGMVSKPSLPSTLLDYSSTSYSVGAG